MVDASGGTVVGEVGRGEDRVIVTVEGSGGKRVGYVVIYEVKECCASCIFCREGNSSKVLSGVIDDV